MAVFTFSTRDKRPQDAEAVLELKAYCEKNHKNFSALVVEQLAKLNKELNHGRQD